MMRPLRTLARYRRLLARYLRSEWARVVLLACTLLATIGVQVAAPLAIGRFIDRAVAGGATRTLLLLAALTVLLAVARQTLAIAETYFAERVSWAATNALRVDLLAHVLRRDPAFHAAHTPGELIERVDGDVANLARFFSRFVVSILGNALLIAAALGVLWGLDWRIGLSLSGFVVVALVLMLRIRARATPYSAAERQVSAEFYGFIGETLTGREDIRASGAEAFVLRRCAERMRGWLAATLRAQMRGYAMVATGDGIFGLGAAAAFGLSCILFRSGNLSLGAVYLVVRLTDMLREPAEQIRDEVQDLQLADASLGRIEALLAIETTLRDGPLAELPPGPLAITFERVTFAYGDGSPVLRDLDLRVAAGRVLGVVGRSGAGKTTLTRLVPRLYDPRAGVVRLGGVDLREVRLQGVRARVGVVTQHVCLFTASLRDNLTLFDDTVPDARIVAVLDELGLAGQPHILPHGLDTEVSAAALSAGQAQLIACARIFLRNPDVVIFDEASSRLDPVTEQVVHEALRRLLAGRTAMVIAHRLATLAFADDILVLEEGRAREHGSRQSLAADPTSRFAELLRLAGTEVVA